MKPSWGTLTPILGPGASDEAVWDALLAHHDFVLGAVRRIVLRAPDVLAAHGGDADAAVHAAFRAVIERLARRALDADGRPRAPRPAGSAAKWLFNQCAEAARDWVKSQRRRLRREAQVADGHGPVEVAPPIVWDDAALRKLQRLLDHPERAGVPATHVLAYLCIYRPDVLTHDIVASAHGYVPSAGSRSGRPGLLRPTEETWALLVAWRARHGVDWFSAAARLELAWILRSDDAGDPDAWRERDRRGARTATVTLGKWAIRCADVLTLPRK